MDLQQQLQQLKDMHDQGLITPEVYAEQQRVILASQMPGNASTTPAAPARVNTKPHHPFWQQLLIAVFAIVGVIVIGYQFSDRKGKDSMNQMAATLGIAKVIPWADRADTAARSILSANQENFPKSILAMTHPTGRNPTLARSSVTKLDGRILVEITVGWSDAFIAKNHETTVVWEIAEGNHVSAKITSDDAIVRADQHDKDRLDDYFRTNAYPAFYKTVNGS